MNCSKDTPVPLKKQRKGGIIGMAGDECEKAIKQRFICFYFHLGRIVWNIILGICFYTTVREKL